MADNFWAAFKVEMMYEWGQGARGEEVNAIPILKILVIVW
jgi:hypothetical protein